VSTTEYYETYWTTAGFNPTGGLPSDLARLYGQRVTATEDVLDVGCGDGRTSGTFLSGHARSYTGADISGPAVEMAREAGLDARLIEDAAQLPFEDASFDVVISNGVINLSVVKDRVFAEAARVLRPGGRLAVADIVSGKPLKERTRRNVELWAACIAGAIPRSSYVNAIAAAGFDVGVVRRNDYRFISDRALDACSTYEVESVSLVAVKL
jgi:arsenite methyltransferase